MMNYKSQNMQLLTKSLLILILFGINTTLFSQNAWTNTSERNIQLSENCIRYTIPEHGATFSLNLRRIKTQLLLAPMENSRSRGVIIELPLPDGTFDSFTVFESPVMQEALAAKFPSIKTYFGKSKLTNATVRMDFTPTGFHALINNKNGQVYIDPYAINQDEYYIVYFQRDLLSTEKNTFICGENEINTPTLLSNDFSETDLPKLRSKGGEAVTERTYTVAIAANAEFTAFHGGKTDAMAAIVTILNRLNQVFNTELAIKLVLVNDNDKLIFENSAIDGYSNGSTQKMIDENQKIIDKIIGNAYAWGHVFGTHGSFSGLAQLAAVCSGSRARGVSLHRKPVNDAFVVAIVAHEMGHQMGASHSMSSCHNVYEGGAYEPGSGSTIMSYAGICSFGNNIVNKPDPYYFTNSLEQIKNYMFNGNGNSCAQKVVTENTSPTVEIPLENGFFIPISTPFELDAIGSDLENDELTYCWEQYDLGPMSVPGSPEGNSPIFRSFPPTTNSKRTFPKLSNIIQNTSRVDEVLPTYNRDLTFRCTVRDNVAEYGGTTWETIAFEATEKAGPFQVKYPNSRKDTLIINDIVAIKWNVANTDLAPVNCKMVNIYLSTDGGYTYPITLAENVANDGTEYVKIPDVNSNTARIKIKGADNIFFDISNFDCTIIPAEKPDFSFGVSPDVQHICLPESATIDIVTSGLMNLSDDITFSVVSDLPENVLATFTNSTSQPGEMNQLVLNFSNHLDEGTYTFEIEGKINNELVSTHPVTITTTSNVFTSIQLENPENSASTDELPTYSWTTATDADEYLLEVALSPSFEASTIVQSTITTEDSLISTTLLDQNEIYFWRITPLNECGHGNPIGVYSFHTNSVNCVTYEQDNANIPITQSGKPYRESIIDVFDSGKIADVNLPTFHGIHDWFSDLDVTLTSPAGTKVILFQDKCFNYNGQFSFKLDDQSPKEFSCPPKGAYFQPEEPLSAFINEDTKGKWTVGIQDDTGGNGGQFGGWSLELCGSINAASPAVTTNETMPVQQGKSRIISSDFLSTNDPVLASKDLQYVIVNTPTYGNITRYKKILGIGDVFNEYELAHNSIVYKHLGSDSETDEFPFIVKNADRAWTGQQSFKIVIDENAVISDIELLNFIDLKLYPNPATNTVTLDLNNTTIDRFSVQLFNINGQQILNIENQNDKMIHLDVASYPSGIYFVKVISGMDIVTKKLILE